MEPFCQDRGRVPFEVVPALDCCRCNVLPSGGVRWQVRRGCRLEAVVVEKRLPCQQTVLARFPSLICSRKANGERLAPRGKRLAYSVFL